jgi:hypothetical protein
MMLSTKMRRMILKEPFRVEVAVVWRYDMSGLEGKRCG